MAEDKRIIYTTIANRKDLITRGQKEPPNPVPPRPHEPPPPPPEKGEQS
jgi:hypothetical protein